MKKYWMSAFLTMLLAATLSGCGGEKTNVGDETQQVTETEKETEERTEEETEDVAFNTEGIIEETVLIDENNIKVTATELNYTKYDAELSIVIENNSDKDLNFSSYACKSINGYMMHSGYFEVDVAAGKKANEVLQFRLKELQTYGITEIADIQLGIVTEDDDYNEVKYDPKQIKTALADSYDYETDTYQAAMKDKVIEDLFDYTVEYYEEDELYNQNDLRIVSKAVIEDDEGKKVVFLEFINDSSEIRWCRFTDVRFNNLVVSDGIWTTAALNPKSREIVELDTSLMLEPEWHEMFGISEIESVGFNFAMRDNDGEDVGEEKAVDVAFADKLSKLDTSGTELYNAGDIRIIAKGIVEEPSKYSDDIHVLLMIENNSEKAIRVEVVNDTLSINGFMADSIFGSVNIPAGTSGLSDIQIYSSQLEEAGIDGYEAIENIEVTLDIQNEKGDSIEEASVKVERENTEK